MKLTYKIDPYGGAIIDTPAVTITTDQFETLIKLTLKKLQEQKLNLAWLQLPTDQANLVEITVRYGFFYHHADAKGLQLVSSLKADAFIPGYATHYIGAGGVVIDDDNRILTIQEKYHTRKHYKLPGGALDPDEHISKGVVREVFEETGIKTEFISLNCFRHWHGYRYGKSDIYFVCSLKPLSSEITIDPREISEAIWMPVDEFLTHADTHPFNRKIVNTAINARGLQIEEIEDYGTRETHEMMF